MEISRGRGTGTGVARARAFSQLSPFRSGSGWLNGLKRSPASGPALVLLICLLFCWKLTLSNQYTWIDSPDIVNMDAPRLQFQRIAWHNHEFPLWDPYLWCGQPFLGGMTGGAFPFNWPLFLRRGTGEDRLTLGLLNWYWVYLHFLAALFAYWLCRELRCSQIASVTGAVVYSFAGFSSLMRWPEVFGGLLLAPLVVLFLLRARRGARPWSSAALSGMFLGLAWLSGHHEVPLYLSFTVASIWIYDFAVRTDGRRRSAALAATSLITTILSSGFQTLPGYEYARLAVRWTGTELPQAWNETIPYQIHTQYSMHPSALLDLVLPWSAANSDAFMGFVVVVLAALAVCVRWHEPIVRLLTAVALTGFLLALGGSNLFHGILYAVLPLFGKARVPSRLLSIFLLGIAPLAALGADALRTHETSRVLRVTGRILLAFGAGVWALGLVAPAFHVPGPTDALYLAALLTLFMGALLLARNNGAVSARFAMLGAFALACIELATVSTSIYVDRNPGERRTTLPALTQFDTAAKFLRAQPPPVRVDTGDVADAFNFGDWEGIDTLNGFTAGATTNLLDMGWSAVPVANLLGVNYSFSKRDPRPDQQLVFKDRSGFNIYKNVNAFPRAWIVHRAEQRPSRKVLNAWLSSPRFDARQTALLLDTVPALQNCVETTPVQTTWRTANTVRLSAQPACRGMLILADTWYPGWRALVDGRNVPIYEVDSALRGIVIEAGPHRIEFRYNPASAWIGGAMSVCGILLACVVWVWERRSSTGSASAEFL